MDNGDMNGMNDARWLWILMGLLVSSLLLWSIWSCTTSRTAETRDSIRTELRYIETVRHDTAYVSIPKEEIRTVTRDTVSRLKTDFAWSEARVDSFGLHHSLGTVQAEVPVKVETKDVVRDSIVYRDRNTINVRQVERPLTWWQKTQIYGFRMCMLFLVGWLLCRLAIRTLNK